MLIRKLRHKSIKISQVPKSFSFSAEDSEDIISAILEQDSQKVKTVIDRASTPTVTPGKLTEGFYLSPSEQRILDLGNLPNCCRSVSFSGPFAIQTPPFRDTQIETPKTKSQKTLRYIEITEIIPQKKVHTPSPSKSLSKSSPSILKKIKRDIPKELQRLITQREKRKNWERECIMACKKGRYITKLTSLSKPLKRFMRISDDETELLWDHTPGKSYRKKELLADVRLMTYGPYSPKFSSLEYGNKKNTTEITAWLCFTLHFSHRTIDIIAVNKNDLVHWFTAIQALVPLNKQYLSPGILSWKRAAMRLCVRAIDEQVARTILIRQVAEQALRLHMKDEITKKRLKEGRPIIDVVDEVVSDEEYLSDREDSVSGISRDNSVSRLRRDNSISSIKREDSVKKDSDKK